MNEWMGTRRHRYWEQDAVNHKIESSSEENCKKSNSTGIMNSNVVFREEWNFEDFVVNGYFQ